MHSISELEKKISAANLAYSKGDPYLTDEEYHDLWRALRSLDPKNPVLYHTSRNPHASEEIFHKQKVLSLQKAFNSHDLKIFFQRFRNDSFILQPKYDGISIILYPNPDLSSYPLAVLSGDGTKGQDVSWMLPNLPSIPDISGLSSLSCEAIIPWKAWNPKFGSNPRNTVAGIFNPSRKDPSELLSHVILQPHDDLSFTEELSPFSNFSSPEELSEYLLERFYHYSTIFPIDGLVLKLSDPHKRLAISHNQTYPLWAIAWKPPIQTEETTIEEIIFNVSRSGRVIPKIKYSPVNLCGTINQYATANNCQWLKDHKISLGSSIIIGKAGEIIPKILEVKSSPSEISLPSQCPVCSSALIWSGVHLICEGSSCISQKVKSLHYFYSDLKTIGPSTIEELLENSHLREILSASPWALLDPESFQIKDLLYLMLGEKRYNNYLSALEKFSLNPAEFIARLGYPRLGLKTTLSLIESIKDSKSLSRAVPFESQKSFEKALSDLQRASSELKNFSFSPLPSPPIATYCITGELHLSRNEIISELSRYNLKFSSGVSKSLDFLILGDNGLGTRKHQKAKKYNIPILTYQEVITKYHLKET